VSNWLKGVLLGF